MITKNTALILAILSFINLKAEDQTYIDHWLMPQDDVIQNILLRQRNNVLESKLANKTELSNHLVKKLWSESIRPTGSSIWNNYILHYGSKLCDVCVKNPMQMYADNWTYTVPWTVTILAGTYAAYKTYRWFKGWRNGSANQQVKVEQTTNNAPTSNVTLQIVAAHDIKQQNN